MKVVILDTGCANLFSLAAAVRRLGVAPEITCDERAIRSADRLFLPGVGTAKAAITAIAERGLLDLIREATQPVLGICLGEQLLCAMSEESPKVPLLGIVPDVVKRLDTQGLPLPHMGWNRVTPDRTKDAARKLFAGLDDDEWFYFVHSFAAPVGPSTFATATYGTPFTAGLGRGNFMGVQFHPERSGHAGARLLANFLGV